MKTYKDSKELPLYVYERINTTGDFLYMIKGYEDGDDVSADVKQLEQQFNDVVQDYVVSLNAKNNDIIQHGRIHSSKLELMKFAMARDIITLQESANELRLSLGLDVDNTIINEMLKEVKIPKSKNLIDQISIIDRKIDKLKSDINESEKKLEKNNPTEETNEVDINEIITNVELILERGIDMHKVSLYRFGLMQDQAVKRIELQNKTK